MIKPLLVAFLVAPLVLAATPESAIRQTLDAQVEAWNRADLPAFVESYLDSSETVFIGTTISRGREHLLERYRKTYPTPEKMGKLAFSDLEIQVLSAEYANVRGRYRLSRDPVAGGDARGIFTLLFRNTPKGWKIVQDHTSSDQSSSEAPK